MVASGALLDIVAAARTRALLGDLFNLNLTCLFLLKVWELLQALTLVILLACLAVVHGDIMRGAHVKAASAADEDVVSMHTTVVDLAVRTPRSKTVAEIRVVAKVLL